MKCTMGTQNTEMLLAYAAGKLDPETKMAIERHLAACASCREFERKQAAVWEALDAFEAMPASADFDRRLYQRIDRASTSWWSRIMHPVRPAWTGGWLSRGVPLAATLCLLILAGVISQQPRNLVAPDDRDVATVQPGDVERTLDDMDMLRTIRATASEAGTVNSM